MIATKSFNNPQNTKIFLILCGQYLLYDTYAGIDYNIEQFINALSRH